MGTKIKSTKSFEITLGDTVHTVATDKVGPETTLNEYLRHHLFLTGTKVMCREGGCGVCIVAAEIKDPTTNQFKTFAVNSCLVALYSCSGWKIRTIEDLGNARIGYHPIQQRLADFHGSQCGFCSPGMVMNMYAQQASGVDLTMKQVENSFAGNLCRCTGYRPILAAFKSMAVDATAEHLGQIASVDIEEILSCAKKNAVNGVCKKLCKIPCKPARSLCFSATDSRWYKVYTLNDIVGVLNTLLVGETYMLVAGNTAKGVFKRTAQLDVYIDVSDVAVLRAHDLQIGALILGGNMTLNDAMALFRETSTQQNFSYLAIMADHIDLIASVPVRNIGTLGGNLMMKYAHNEFPSDVFLLLITIGATLTIVNSELQRSIISIDDFLAFDMTKKIIENISLPALDPALYKLVTYKIMPRSQNAHAYVNAGFLIKNPTRVDSARIVYGSISPTFNRAKNTENFLVSKNLFSNTTIQSALATLDTEVLPEDSPPEPAAAYRKNLAKALFYKAVLSLAPTTSVTAANRSGAQKLERPISKGTQVYSTDPSLYPVNKPLRKVEALAQTSGDAQYIYDTEDLPNQLYAAFVTAKAKPKSIITSRDPSAALALPGVVAFYDASDVPGINSFATFSQANALYFLPEKVFAEIMVLYYDQPVGLIVAENWQLAEKAAKLVQIGYNFSTEKTLTTIKDVLDSGDESRIKREEVVPEKPKVESQVDKGLIPLLKILIGEVLVNTQYHFHMENQCVQVIPEEDGLRVYASSQFVDYTQACIGSFLDMPNTKINVVVRRLGGGFGAKLSRGNLLACAASLAATKLNRPVKILMPLETNMRVMGKRTSNHAFYEMAVLDTGLVVHNNINYFVDVGAQGGNENPIFFATTSFISTYLKTTITALPGIIKSDIPSTAYTRAPGSADAVGIVEAIMERAAYTIGMDPFDFRFMNVDPIFNTPLRNFMKDFRTWSNLDARTTAVKAFNQANRWIKKGICAVPMVFPMPHIFYPFTALVSLYQGDGSVAISHGGTEMGQGVNTKAVQVAAKVLGVSEDVISVKPTNNVTGANNFLSGASVTTDGVCHAVKDACEILNKRLDTIRLKYPEITDWVRLLKAANMDGVNLSAHGIFTITSPGTGSYLINCVGSAEVTVDILTGQHRIDRVDILEDVGSSLNQAVDIGQIEGAFIMGVGMWMTEKIVMDDEGQLLTDSTWQYKVPGAKDIPVEFNVKLPQNSNNSNGVFNSKAVGEPPLCLSVCVPLALRNAVASARLNSDANANFWYPIMGPSSIDDTFMNSMNKTTQYKL